MKDERIIDLVNGELDGMNSTADQEELTSLLEKDPSLKGYLEEMKTLDQVLAAVPMVEPPAGLKRRIMNSVAHQGASLNVAPKATWFDRLLAPFLQRPAWAISYAFAIGLIVGLGVLSIIESSNPDVRTVQGTIVDHSPVIANTTITAGPASADILVTRLDGELRVDLQVTATMAATVRLVSQDRNPIVIASDPGTASYSLLLEQTPSIDVTLSAGETSSQTVVALTGSGAQ